MGTLTVGQVRLPGYCDHKLPTSCRLTSLANCCACADERAHSAAYNNYVDGIGVVYNGTRWQRYCWFCREFWKNRVEASGLSPEQTRVPDAPDQTDFLRRWYEFFEGHRVVQKEDGTEERIAVVGEDFRDVDPGVLPRTLDELRAGRTQDAIREVERTEARRRAALERQEAVDSGPSLDQALDELLDDATQEEERNTTTQSNGQEWELAARAMAAANVHAQSITAAGSRSREYTARRIAALRRELLRMRRGLERVIHGLRDLGEDIPEQEEATNRLTELGETIDRIAAPRTHTNAAPEGGENGNAQPDSHGAYMQNLEQLLQEARRNNDEARARKDQADEDYRVSENELRRLLESQRTAENYTRLFGTREEMAAQGDDYVSPIGNMFDRAMDRFRVAEEVRREERNMWQMHDARRHIGDDVDETNRGLGLIGEEVGLAEHYAQLRRQDWTSRPRNAQVTGEQTANADTPNTASFMSDGVEVATSSSSDSQDERALVTYILTQLAEEQNRNWRRYIPGEPSTMTLRRLEMHHEDYQNNSLCNRIIDFVMSDTNIMWGIGVPTYRVRTLTDRGEVPVLTPRESLSSRTPGQVAVDIEILMDAYEVQPELRQFTGLNATEQQEMLMRVSRGERTVNDRAVLHRVLNDENYDAIAAMVAMSPLRGPRLPQPRYSSANPTHVPLNMMQRTALTYHADPAELLERLADGDAATREAYDRMRANGFDPIALAGDHRRQASSMLDRYLQHRESFTDIFPGLGQNVPDAEPDVDDENARGLDAPNTGRPEEPLSEEAMMVKMDCRICYSQLATIATVPCGHLAMCQWCSDQHSPVMDRDKTRPQRPANCPICRKGIRQKFKVIRA